MNKEILMHPQESASIDTAIRMLAGSADLVGERVFPALVQGIAKSLCARWVFLSRPSSHDPTKATTIAVWDDAPGKNIEYDLAGSPCANIMNDGACCYSEDVQQLFPDDRLLSEMGAESYVGIPLKSSDGQVIGLIAALDDKPIEDADLAIDILSIFSGRAASEIERVMTSTANERLGRIVEDSISEAYVFGGESYLFELVNRGARENLGFSMEELRSLTPWDLKPEYSAQEFQRFVAPLKDGSVPFLDFETIHRRKDLSNYNVSVRLQYFGGADNVFFASIFDITERKMAEEREHLLMREVNHRGKNLLSIVQAVARQTAASGFEGYVERFEERISALAASHDLIVESPKTGVQLFQLVQAQLGHFCHLFDNRIRVAGPELRLTPSAAQSIGMALHELATNAAKYGALSNNVGTVVIKWETAANEEGLEFFTMTWSELDGPCVAEPARRGFGSTIIQAALQSSVRGQVDLHFGSPGLQFKLSCALPSIAERDARARSRQWGDMAPNKRPTNPL